jgi:hypothetical protein
MPALDVWAFGMTLLDLLKGPTTGPRSRDFWRTAFRGHRHEHEYVHLIKRWLRCASIAAACYRRTMRMQCFSQTCFLQAFTE